MREATQRFLIPISLNNRALASPFYPSCELLQNESDLFFFWNIQNLTEKSSYLNLIVQCAQKALSLFFALPFASFSEGTMLSLFLKII